MQHSLYRNPASRGRAMFPLIVDLMADGVVWSERIVAPLTPQAGGSKAGSSLATLRPGNKALPAVTLDGVPYLVMLTMLGTVPERFLGTPLGSVAAWRDDITRALDWFFWGV
jgi:hypothetical protein